jgi:hypothetical protein
MIQRDLRGRRPKRVATNAVRRKAALEWERSNLGPFDAQEFRLRILPKLRAVTIPEMMRVTGLSSSYCWRIRRGERILHPMYWESLRSLSTGLRDPVSAAE